MCGRTRCTLRPNDVPRASHRHSVPTRFLHLDRYRPSYNVAPGSYIPVLRRDNEVVGDGVVVHCMKWGLIPSFTKKSDKPDFFKMFNARSESVGEKASFRRLLPKNRCLVTVDGFYEWKKDGSKKQPYYIHFEDGRPLVFAALFDSWQNSGVILGDKDSVDTWLDDPSTSRLQPLLSPYEKSDLVWYPVTSAIGKPTFDGPECIQQIPLKASQNSLISKFFSTKQPKIDEGNKESKSTNANIPIHLKEEPTVEVCEEAVSSDSFLKMEELHKEKHISNEAKNLCAQEIVKVEPIIEDNSAFSSHLQSVKNEVEESTYGEGKSVKSGESYNLDFPRISKEEPEESNQLELPHESVEDKPGNENQKTVLTCQTTTEGGLEFSEKSGGKSGTKRDYEVFSAQAKPLKQKLQDVKSSGKHGRKQRKGKSNIKKSKETVYVTFLFR